VRGFIGTKRIYIEQADHLRAAVIRIAVEGQLIHEAAAEPAAMHDEVIQLDQAFQVQAQRGIGDATQRPNILAAEPHVLRVHRLHPGTLVPVRHQDTEQAPRLRRHFIERAPQHVMRQAIGQRDIVERDLDILDHLAPDRRGLQRSLVLVQKRDRIDQRQVLGMIAAHAGGFAAERQRFGIGIDHRHRPQQRLRRLVPRPDRGGFFRGQQAR
jgi:hypothetical protein